MEEMMENIKEFRVLYDENSDVLYITTPHQPVALERAGVEFLDVDQPGVRLAKRKGCPE
jgi:hypothetical protein